MLVAYEQRYYPAFDPKVRFTELVRERGFCLETVPPSDHHPSYSLEDVELWWLRRREKVEK